MSNPPHAAFWGTIWISSSRWFIKRPLNPLNKIKYFAWDPISHLAPIFLPCVGGSSFPNPIFCLSLDILKGHVVTTLKIYQSLNQMRIRNRPGTPGKAPNLPSTRPLGLTLDAYLFSLVNQSGALRFKSPTLWLVIIYNYISFPFDQQTKRNLVSKTRFDCSYILYCIADLVGVILIVKLPGPV